MRISDWSSDVCSSDLDPLPGRTAEHHALVRHVAGNTRLRLRAESVLWRGAGTAGRGLVPGVSANSPSPGLPGAWRRVAVNRKPTHDQARVESVPRTHDLVYLPVGSIDDDNERLTSARPRHLHRHTRSGAHPATRKPAPEH